MGTTNGGNPMAGLSGLAANPLFAAGSQILSNSLPGPVYRPLMMGVPQSMMQASQQAMLMQAMQRQQEEYEREKAEREATAAGIKSITGSWGDYKKQLPGYVEDVGDYMLRGGPIATEAGRAGPAPAAPVAPNVAQMMMGMEGSPSLQAMGLSLATKTPTLTAVDPWQSMVDQHGNVVVQGTGTAPSMVSGLQKEWEYIQSLPPGPERTMLTEAFRGKNQPMSATATIAGDTEAEKLAAQRYDKLYGSIQEAAQSTARRAANYGLINRLLGSRGGFGAPTKQQLMRAGKSFGLDFSEVGANEAAAMLSNEMALQLRNPAGGAGMPGAMSDKDREFLTAMVPGLSNTAEGRAIMGQVQGRIAKRDKQVAQMARNYVMKNKVLDARFEQMVADRFSNSDLFEGLELPGEVDTTSPDELLHNRIYEDKKTGEKARWDNVNKRWLDPETNQPLDV